MAASVPGRTGRVLLLDAGANAEADTLHLANLLRSLTFSSRFRKVSTAPRLGLLNIGQEPIKGMRVTQRAFALLQRSRLHFIGNVEPHELLGDRIDAVICDGFTGNVLLKTYEGLSERLAQFIESHIDDRSPELREEMNGVLEKFQKTHHYQNVGGAPLLGPQKTVVVAHGRSQSPAIANAIRLADRLADAEVYRRISEQLLEGGILAELKHLNTVMMLENFKYRWGFTPSRGALFSYQLNLLLADESCVERRKHRALFLDRRTADDPGPGRPDRQGKSKARSSAAR